MRRLAVVVVAVLSACGAVENHEAGTPCSPTANQFDHYCTADHELTICRNNRPDGGVWEAVPCSRCVKDREPKDVLDCSSGNGLCNCE